jgi:polyhydroxybutyrate depolymerase
MTVHSRLNLGTVILLCSVLLFSVGGSDSLGSGGGSGGRDSCNFQAGGNCTLVVNGVTRNYRLHTPSRFRANSSALVIALHGSRGSGPGFESYTRLSQKADQVGFAVAYPSALPNSSGATSWNIFYDFGFTNPPDDVAFLRQLITTIQSNLHPDPKKIYVTGFSSGGYMTHRAGVELADLVAAIGVVEGSLSDIAVGDTRTVPPAVAPVSVLVLHGSADKVIRLCGLSNSRLVVPSQEDTFNYWAGPSANRCSTLSTPNPLCTADFTGTPTDVYVKSATACKAGTEVRFYQLIGGNHNWYSVPLNVPPGTGSSPYNPKFNAATGIVTNDILWTFFAAHPKP